LEAAALAKWKQLNLALSAAEREELFMVCVLGSWPFWMPKRAKDHALGAKDSEKVSDLMLGLSAIGRALRPPKATEARIMPLPFRRTRAGRSEAPVRYVTTDGHEIEPTSQHGVAFEAAILRRRD